MISYERQNEILELLKERRTVTVEFLCRRLFASPNSFHAAQSIMLLTGKKHVLCEKPAASNAWEWSAMVRAAEKNGVVVLEAMRPVFHPGFQAIKDCLPRLGTLRRATFIYCQYSSRYASG